jgi:hypothetical protein
LINNDSMAITFNTMIAFNAEEVFYFRSISCIVDQGSILSGPIQEETFPSGAKSGCRVVTNGASENSAGSVGTSAGFRSA